MPDITIQLVRDEATPKLRMLADRYPAEHGKALFRAGSIVERQAKHNLSGGRLRARTGRLRGSVRTEVHGDEARIGSNVVYAAIHEFGGEIVPKRASALHFQTSDGHWVTTQRVHMPARHWLSSALEESWAKVRDVFEETIRRLIA